jgi:hypothetical protein
VLQQCRRCTADQIAAAFRSKADSRQNQIKEFGMNEDRILADRAAIERRVANFRETQARFQRERDDYYDVTIEKVRATDWNEFVTLRPSD